MTDVLLRFSDWGYDIGYCTPYDHNTRQYYTLKFPVAPPTGIKKTWEVTVTTQDLKIKCNSLGVLHSIFKNTYRDDCAGKVKGNVATKVQFHKRDTATKTFTP